MYFGSNYIGGLPGITLTGSANAPASNQGQYSWMQVLSAYNWRFINADGRWLCPLDYSPEGDGVAEPGTVFSDNPWVLATPNFGETQVSFYAAAYFMWTPNAASSCTGPSCTAPIPLAVVNWSWTADAIDNNPSSAAFALTGCQGCSSSSPQSTATFPQWTGNTKNGCQPQAVN